MAADDTLAPTDLSAFIAGLPELVQLARNAFEIACISAGARDAFLAELHTYAAAHGV